MIAFEREKVRLCVLFVANFAKNTCTLSNRYSLTVDKILIEVIYKKLRCFALSIALQIMNNLSRFFLFFFTSRIVSILLNSVILLDYLDLATHEEDLGHGTQRSRSYPRILDNRLNIRGTF